ncbi:hypothetical protein N5923_19110 [Erwiniaceae bacterium BAC15a-03b]|uniref:Uncharacterized protein n=1 Tax=Winslowiella arboricola TaxID=2978220 RepID=A0A9J6Q024_9GAMM|nr:hypothetical protein [Winslowiella arboricola]MCU5775551.1 hypothetical protein [Winslowiella arboricola]MCU5779599.1 hypothetical protein [Winslowiella arboricola]
MKSAKSLYSAASACVLASAALIICCGAVYQRLLSGATLSWSQAISNHIPWGVAFVVLYVASIAFSLLIARTFFAESLISSPLSAESAGLLETE